MIHLYLCIEDQPAPGGYIIHSPDPSGVTYMMYEHHVAYIGSEAHCNACNSKGLIAKAGGAAPPYSHGAGDRAESRYSALSVRKAAANDCHRSKLRVV